MSDTTTTPVSGQLTLTVEEAGRLLGISRGAAYRAAACGQIPTIRLGRRLLVPRARLHQLLGISSSERPESVGGAVNGVLTGQ
jgi:excisionase family DNA binding protein